MLAIGITGTNGKTSITYMLESIMKRYGRNPGVIGTINYRWGGREYPAPNTTPESRDLQEILYRMKRDGVDAVIMEVSSHALELRRADDIDFDAAVFTNLTRDHLDFHHDFESYFNAKKRLFTLLEKSFKKGRCGVVNVDDAYGRELFMIRNQYSYPVKSFGIDTEADYMPEPGTVSNTIGGRELRLARPDAGIAVNLNLLGTFQLYNSLAALAVVAPAWACPMRRSRRGLADLETVPGRFDVLKTGKGFVVIVDYAHTVDALLKLLKSVNELEHRRVITVFGCGGDRDRTKRPLMGKRRRRRTRTWSSSRATIPAPRTPAGSSARSRTGSEGNNHEIIPDREEAIARADGRWPGDGDIVVIAGKGHEDYQIIGTEKIHFDDKEVAARCMQEGSGDSGIHDNGGKDGGSVRRAGSPSASRRTVIETVTTDSREPGVNSLFMPLVGERYDGHDFIRPLSERNSIRSFLTMRDGFTDIAGAERRRGDPVRRHAEALWVRSPRATGTRSTR